MSGGTVFRASVVCFISLYSKFVIGTFKFDSTKPKPWVTKFPKPFNTKPGMAVFLTGFAFVSQISSSYTSDEGGFLIDLSLDEWSVSQFTVECKMWKQGS